MNIQDLMGMKYTPTFADLNKAAMIGDEQHINSAARGTRNAGANREYRIKGALGEIIVARLLGIDPQVRALAGPDPAADIIWNDLEIEVKMGLPMEARTKLNTNRWYVAVNSVWSTKEYQVVAVTHGSAIAKAAQLPPAHWCPRPGTRELNYRIDI